MNNLKEKAKTPFEVWQQTVLEALKNLPKAFNTGELSDEISRIRKRKDWIKFVDAQKEIDHLNDLFLKYNQEAVDYEQKAEKEMEQLKHKLRQLSNEIREKADFEFEHTQIDRESGYFISNPQQDFNSFLSWITKKFEELLKEDEKP